MAHVHEPYFFLLNLTRRNPLSSHDHPLARAFKLALSSWRAHQHEPLKLAMQAPAAVPPLVTAIVQGLAQKHQLDTARVSHLLIFAKLHITNPLDVHALYATLEAYIGRGAQALDLPRAPTPPCIANTLPTSPMMCTDDVPTHVPSLAKHEHIVLPCDFAEASLTFEQKDKLTEIAWQVIYTQVTTLVTSRFTQAMRCEILKRTDELDLAWVWEGPGNYRNIMREVQLVGMLARQQFRLDLVGSLNRSKPLTLRAFSMATTCKYLPAGTYLLDTRAVGRNAVLRRWVYENFQEIESALIYFNPPPTFDPTPRDGGCHASLLPPPYQLLGAGRSLVR
ncbi:hypothetical protein JB92DRAFT_3118556 [Gautieria morchelliformis]|nr:hypothetical protein JB92DRAFT_3118556 [Gautieria morchelliformis]